MTLAELTPRAVAEVVAKITGHQVAQVDRLSGSAFNHNFMLTTGGGDFVLKASSVQDFAVEAWSCERVRREGVRAPEIVGFETKAQSLPMPFLLMRRLQGRPAGPGSPALAALGQQLAMVHSIHLEGHGALTVRDAQASGTAGSWAGFLTELTSGLDDLVAAQVLTQATAAEAVLALERSGDAICPDHPPVLPHGDLKLEHVLVAPGRQVGLIDWGDACAGDPRLDLGRLSMAGAAVLSAVLSGYGLELTPELSRTFAYYRMVWAIDSLTYEFRAGGTQFDRGLAQIAVDTRELS